jgi:DNA modification methylase
VRSLLEAWSAQSAEDAPEKDDKGGPETFHDGRVVLHAGDCLTVLEGLPENSVDAVVVDPPYHLTSIVRRFGKEGLAPAGFGTDGVYSRGSTGFMGRAWDGGDVAFRPETWDKVRRVLKPGGHLAAFAAAKNSHRMVCAIEDAGFEVRDSIMEALSVELMQTAFFEGLSAVQRDAFLRLLDSTASPSHLLWVFGMGFPKSLALSKAINKAAGVRGHDSTRFNVVGQQGARENRSNLLASNHPDYVAPVGITPEAKRWEGWGTALKPAFEPICLARKPLSEKTVAANVLRWGTGALNIDACRIEGGLRPRIEKTSVKAPTIFGLKDGSRAAGGTTLGRWPANIVLDGSDEVLAAFPRMESRPPGTQRLGFGNSGSAARFFYSSKASKRDRIEATHRNGAAHPTVKPISLMRWLVRMVTPPGGTVLDCFAGTGTTGAAAVLEDKRAILIEREDDYVRDIRKRMEALKP